MLPLGDVLCVVKPLIFYVFKARAEKEIRDLGAVKEKLEAEWELVKFMGQVW